MIQNILCFLEESARKYPNKIAFRDEKKSYDYKQLLESSRRIGSCLAQRVPIRQPIPVLAEKSADVVALFMGIVTAGCFYVFIDLSQPEVRLKKILDTLGANIVIADEGILKQNMAAVFTGTVVDIQTLLTLPESAEHSELLLARRKQTLDIDPLYGMFTSGSTGEPKGVIVSHRSVIDFIGHFTELFDITEQDVIGNQAPFDFDVSVKDIYSALSTGATVEIIPKRLFSIPMELMDYLCERNITTAIWAVSALCIISTLGGFSYRVPQKLRNILFSGEVMPIKHLNIWRHHLSDAMFVNLYGPTEITCNCTYYVIDREFVPGETIPIGIPFPNESVFLLDESENLVCQPLKTGEICISGTALALGYYRNPEKTAQVFVQNPLNQCYAETIYKTGDLAHVGTDGLLYFESRKDFQIKHMGHRIELGEIETAFEAVEGVDRVVCIYVEEKNKIAAFYQGKADKKSIARALGTILPAYMIPQIFRSIVTFPTTKNGKIDRRQLLEEVETRR